MPANTNQEGGLVLKRAYLEKILAESNTVGLAFSLAKPGVAPNVNIKVHRVYAQGDILMGEVRICRSKKSASGALHYPSKKVNHFQFKYLEELQKDKFFFGFYSKDEFRLLFKGDWDEVFVGGGKVAYSGDDFIEIPGKTEYFTFTLSLRKKVQQIKINKDKSLNSLLAKRWPNNPRIDLNQLATKKYIPLDEMNQSDLDEDINEVKAIIIDEDTNYVKGLAIKAKGRIRILQFNFKHNVKSVILYPNRSLRYLEMEMNDDSPLPVDKEEGWRLGPYPAIVFMRGCPPDWDNMPRI